MGKPTRAVLRGGGGGNVAPLTRPQCTGRIDGTSVVNLETRTVIAVLADRTAATVAAALAEHPEIEVVSRDRAGCAGRFGHPSRVPSDAPHLKTEQRERTVSYQRPRCTEPGANSIGLTPCGA